MLLAHQNVQTLLWCPSVLAFGGCQLCFSLKRPEPEVVEALPPVSRRGPDRDSCIFSHARDKAIYSRGTSLLLTYVYT